MMLFFFVSKIHTYQLAQDSYFQAYTDPLDFSPDLVKGNLAASPPSGPAYLGMRTGCLLLGLIHLQLP